MCRFSSAQIHLFMFAGAIAAGTIIGGPIGDRIGRKYVIWCSILGVLPFTLALPYANLFWTSILSVVIGVILASAFSAILVYAQELMPGKIGMISGLFFGLAFGMGGRGRGVARQFGGPHQHHVRLQGVLFPAGHWFTYRISAESGNQEAARPCRRWPKRPLSPATYLPATALLRSINTTSRQRPFICPRPLSLAHDPKSRAFVQRDARDVLGKDAGLQRPDALGFRLGDQPRHQLPSHSASSGAFRHVDADLGHARINAAARIRRSEQPIPKHRHRTAPRFSPLGK